MTLLSTNHMKHIECCHQCAESSTHICTPFIYEMVALLTIPNFDEVANTLPNGEALRSTFLYAPFKDSGMRYHVNIYPNGSTEKYKNNLSMFVHLTADAELRCREKTRDTDLGVRRVGAVLPDAESQLIAANVAESTTTIHSELLSAPSDAYFDQTQIMPPPIDRTIAAKERETEEAKSYRQVHIRFSFVNRVNQPKLDRCASKMLIYNWAEPIDERQIDNNWGYRRFCRSDDLLNYLDDGHLRIKIELKVLVGNLLNTSPVRHQASECALKRRIIDHLRKRVENDDLLLRLPDRLALTINGQNVAVVHRHLFCSVFGPLKESTNTFELNDLIDVGNAHQLLTRVLVNLLYNQTEALTNFAITDHALLMQLALLAHKSASAPFRQLVERCFMLKQGVTPILLTLLDAQSSLRHTIECNIARNWHEIRNSPEIKRLSIQSPEAYQNLVETVSRIKLTLSFNKINALVAGASPAPVEDSMIVAVDVNNNVMDVITDDEGN